jgi:hypothetical protein
METAQTINAIANLIMTLGIAAFMIFVFGKNNMMYKITWIERNFIKLALATAACGSLYNFLTFTNPPTSEIILNVGLAMIFSWGAYFHFKYFVK